MINQEDVLFGLFNGFVDENANKLSNPKMTIKLWE